MISGFRLYGQFHQITDIILYKVIKEEDERDYDLSLHGLCIWIFAGSPFGGSSLASASDPADRGSD